MHAILALSALHIYSTAGGLREHDEYRDDALRYYNIASTLFRRALGHANENNKDALFAVSTLLAIFVHASRVLAQMSDGSSCLDDIATFGALGKGARAIVEAWHRPAANPTWVQPLRELKPWDEVVLPDEMQDAFITLSSLAAASTDDEHRKETYCRAIKALKEPYQSLSVNPGRPTLPFYWFVLMEKEFVELIQQRDRLALVIVAHHAALLSQYTKYWWAGNRGVMLIKEICDILDTSVHNILVWPASSCLMTEV